VLGCAISPLCDITNPTASRRCRLSLVLCIILRHTPAEAKHAKMHSWSHMSPKLGHHACYNRRGRGQKQNIAERRSPCRHLILNNFLRSIASCISSADIRTSGSSPWSVPISYGQFCCTAALDVCKNGAASLRRANYQ
jgi:hypothetical protein